MATSREGKKKVEKFISSEGHIRDRVVFHQTAEMPKEGVFLGLNGVSFQVLPDKPVDIPRPVRMMVDTLFYTDIIQDEAGGEYKRHRKRFPYTLIQEGVNIKPTPGAPEADASPLSVPPDAPMPNSEADIR